MHIRHVSMLSLVFTLFLAPLFAEARSVKLDSPLFASPISGVIPSDGDDLNLLASIPLDCGDGAFGENQVGVVFVLREEADNIRIQATPVGPDLAGEFNLCVADALAVLRPVTIDVPTRELATKNVVSTINVQANKGAMVFDVFVGP